jgi:hypothetical protein
MYPSDLEVLRAAKRIASKFPPRKAFGLGPRVRMVSGALATIAGVAYAGSGNWADLTARFGHGVVAARATTEEQVGAAVAAHSAARNSGPHDPKEDRVGVVPERLAMEESMAASAESASKVPKKKVLRTAVVPHIRRASVAAAAVGATDGKELVSVSGPDRLESTWADVNAALASLDYRRAESLLIQLSDGGHDSDTRAKANLGLAQLAAARGDCDHARVLALGVAAAPGIEMKTVRRALELAVRCAH